MWVPLQAGPGEEGAGNQRSTRPLRDLRIRACLARRQIRSEVLPHRLIVMARRQRHRFRVALLEGEPAMFVGYLGYVEAADDKAAIEAAAREFKIAGALRDRIVARRDE